MYADYPDSGFRPTRPYRYMRLPGQELSPSGVPLVLGRINLGMAHDKKSGTMSLILRTEWYNSRITIAAGKDVELRSQSGGLRTKVAE